MAVDCLVIGGGVIGLTTAWRLAQRGYSVHLVDQGIPGREASWAGAGILPPGFPGPASDPLTSVALKASQQWPKLAAELHESTGIDNEFHRCGGIELADGTPAELASEQQRWEAAGARVEWLEPRQIRELETAFSRERGRVPLARSLSGSKPAAPAGPDKGLRKGRGQDDTRMSCTRLESFFGTRHCRRHSAGRHLRRPVHRHSWCLVDAAFEVCRNPPGNRTHPRSDRTTGTIAGSTEARL